MHPLSVERAMQDDRNPDLIASGLNECSAEESAEEKALVEEEAKRKRRNKKARASIKTVIERFDQFERRYAKIEDEMSVLSKKHHRRYGALNASVKDSTCIVGTHDLLWPRIRLLVHYHKIRVKPATFTLFEGVMRGLREWINLNENFKEENINTLEDTVFFILRRKNKENILIANDWSMYQLKKGISPNTVRFRLGAIAGLFKSAKMRGLVETTPRFVKLAATAPVKKTTGPGRKKMTQIIEVLGQRNDPESVQSFAILRMMFDLGARVNELASIKRSSVSLKNRTVKYVTKGESEPVVKHLPEPTFDAIQKWMEVDKKAFYGRRKYDYRQSDHLFHGWYTYANGAMVADRGGKPHVLYERMVALGHEFKTDLGPTKIRHTSITIACEEAQARGLPIESVMSHSGHKRLETILVYRDNIAVSQLKISSLVANSLGKTPGSDVVNEVPQQGSILRLRNRKFRDHDEDE